MRVSLFIRRDFHTILPYCGTLSIKKKLLQHLALVVQDDEMNTLGVLIPSDILLRPHNLVIDCLTPKPALSPDCKVSEALQIMEREAMEVLPVYQNERFEGLVFRNDLLKCLTEEKKELETKVIERTNEIERQNRLLQQISWMQSHETRQPLATLLGLINIIDKSSLTEDNRRIVAMLEKAARELDEVIRNTVIKANSADEKLEQNPDPLKPSASSTCDLSD